MVPRLEQKILIFGYTISQGLILIVLVFALLILFKTLISLLGFFGAAVLGITLVGLPAVLFRITHAIPESYLENAAHFYLIKPDIYLPGKEERKRP